MKLFVWDMVGGATGSYHDGGAVVVIADTLERAREMISADDNRRTCEALTQDADLIRECEGPEHIAIHPDAGCC